MDSFEKPNADSYTIYAKHGCTFCIKAKILLSNVSPPPKIIDCDEYIETNREQFLEFMKELAGKDYRTFPMIFHNAKFVGGFTETKEYHDKLTAFNYMDDFATF